MGGPSEPSDDFLRAPQAGGPRPYERRTLRARHRAVVRALAEVLFSPDGEVDAGRLDRFVGDVDRFLSPASKTLRWGLLVILDLLRWAPILMLRRLSAFESLSRADRTRMVEAMERSRSARLALVVVAYKTVMTILFFESPEELKLIGYPGAERHRYRRGLPLADAAPASGAHPAVPRAPDVPS